MLTLIHLTKRYGYRQVFRDINATIPSGCVAAVTGRNGAGKSTLLRIAAGLIRPSAGKVLLEDAMDVTIGLAAPDAPLYRELTVQENLEFFAHSRPFITEIEPALERFHLKPRRRDLAGDLSSGWRARLQLAVATLAAPKVLLLDEPAANLDEAGHTLLWEILEEQRARGIALVATNDAREASRCDEALQL